MHIFINVFFARYHVILLSNQFFQEILFRGRIRVQLKNDDGTPVKPDLPTRDAVMKHIGEQIPKLKTRQNR